MSEQKKSEEKKRQQAGWWVPALIGLILAAIGIRYASSQGWWENTFDLSRRDYKTINTGLSVQVPNQSEVPVGVQPLNPGRPSQPPTSNDFNQSSKTSERKRRALW
ncbi:MAG: hypothetical protein DCF22_15345 [Leptolyngbya sp.]|nr:MAG: hypothetical protein DCF22_15345 [Leptolyngbya sp.]